MIEIEKNQQQQRNIFTIVETWCIYRGYYMAARRWKFSLSVEKYFTRSLRSLVNIFFNMRREISYRQATM